MTRRRLYVMRHAAVAYFENGRPVHPAGVRLTEAGREQARAAAEALTDVRFACSPVGCRARRRPHASSRARSGARALAGSPRTETGRLGDIPRTSLERVRRRLQGRRPRRAKFLGGETIDQALRPRAPRRRPAARRRRLGRGARGPPRRRQPRHPLPRAHGQPHFLGNSSRRPCASTSSTSATTGSCAR